jgi:uncharacterized FAD-dependent dehydrogenase
VLTEFVKAGAPAEILYVSKPHIGTFKLVTMVETCAPKSRRWAARSASAARVEDIEIDNGQVRGLRLADGVFIAADHVVLAVGHSARDTFQMLHARGVHIEAKPFSIGVRIEHPQSLIDRARFGSFAGHPLLGAADYKLVHHCGNGRSAYSFCMCPGGTVVAATSEPGRVVTNGMSQYSRNERNANAAIVVGVTPADFRGDRRRSAGRHRLPAPLGKPRLRSRRRRLQAPRRSGSATSSPAGRRPGWAAVHPSYTPGVRPTDLAPACPITWSPRCANRCRPSAADPGFDMDDALLTGVETRTSSPMRITRGADFQSLNTRGLYPAGEGAGYAGGILSAAVDGIKVAEAVALSLIARQRS